MLLPGSGMVVERFLVCMAACAAICEALRLVELDMAEDDVEGMSELK